MNLFNIGKILRIGKILKPSGIKGDVRFMLYVSNINHLEKFNPFRDSKGNEIYDLKLRFMIPGQNNIAIVNVNNMTDRNEAEKLKHIELFLPYEKMPILPDGHFYRQDVIGMKVFLPNGQYYGMIKSVQNFSAGDIIEINIHEQHRKISKTQLLKLSKSTLDIKDCINNLDQQSQKIIKKHRKLTRNHAQTANHITANHIDDNILSYIAENQLSDVISSYSESDIQTTIRNLEIISNYQSTVMLPFSDGVFPIFDTRKKIAIIGNVENMLEIGNI